MTRTNSIVSKLGILFSLAFSLSAHATIAGLDAEIANTQGWKSQTEAGVAITAGNTQTSTISAKDVTAYHWSENIVKFGASYLNNSNRGVEQALLWNLGLRYERELSPKVSVFAAENLESDKYQGILQRYASDVGAKYFFEKSQQFSWFAELGYRFARENYRTGFQNLNFGRLFNEFDKAWTNSFSAKWWVEYLPNFTHSAGYQLNSEVSVAAVISEVFSLGAGYQWRYYNAPPAGISQKLDTAFTTSLVAKF